MPPYPGPEQATLLYENRQAYLFLTETAVIGTASVAYQLRRERGNSYPKGISIEIAFSVDPGAYEFDVQAADLDEPGHYVTVGSLGGAGSTTNATFVSRLEFPQWYAKYVRLMPVTQTNAATVSALVTR